MTIAEEMAEEFRVGFNSRKTGFNCWKVEQKEIKELIIKITGLQAANAKLVEALENICAWIDSDSCGGVGSVKRYEEARAVLKEVSND